MSDKYKFIYGFQTYEIPERMRSGLQDYIENRIKPGQFLQAVIKNNLKEAIAYADEENMANLPAYVNYFYNHTPFDCWGSEERMDQWIKNADNK